MTRINSHFEKTRKVSGPRALQTSQWGILCPSDTPEGESCGLVKNLALTTHVTTDSPELPLMKLAIDLGMEDIALMTGDELHSKKHSLVFINGTPMGIHRRANKFVRNFRLLRKKGRVQEFVSIYKNEIQNCIYIASDGGRLVRPLLVCNRGRLILNQQHVEDLTLGLKDFYDFLREGIVEYLDVNEENDALIAVREGDIKPATTHMEIDPFTILGVVSGLVPYPNHNNSPRITF